jgi:hypothetical protein
MARKRGHGKLLSRRAAWATSSISALAGDDDDTI